MARGNSELPTVGATEHVAQNLETVLALRAKEEERVGRHQRLIERLTQSLGRPRTLYLILTLTVGWVAFNAAAPALHWPNPDPPPCYWLQGLVGLSALLMTSMVLTTQNRQGRHAEQRAHLDLQVNLLAEQKVTKLISLMEELRRDLPNVQNRKDSTAEAMEHAVDPKAVMSALEETFDGEHHAATQDTPSGARPKANPG
ncbi:MAG: DUF1003 domain-containing protein [Myxococcota bacterium]|nr:DUF1003 domain-containing protein [Myxococcota bacterium]